MPDQGYDLRPDVETFDCLGCRLVIVDAAGIFAVADPGPVQLLHGGSFPAPVRQVRFSIATGTRDGRRVHLLAADVHTGGWSGLLNTPLGSVMLGIAGPVGVFFARGVATGDPVATKIAAGANLVAAEASKRLGLRKPGGAADRRRLDDLAALAEVREDATSGLRATVTFPQPAAGSSQPLPVGDRIVALRAHVPSDLIASTHLRGMFCLVLQVVAELADESGDPTVLRGHQYVLSRYPGGRPVDLRGADDDVVRLDHVGGLAEVVAQFREIAVSFRHPEAMARWGARRPQGVLLYGPPGTGKTMLARALATEIGANFREIRTPEILDKWLGASERNIKAIFREAKSYRQPTVMLFDEFDSIISYAGAGGDAASQAVNAVAGIFKQEMNNLIEENPNVIVVATTNFPHRVDDSLVRSGRFDIKMAIPLPDEAGRADIIAKMIRQLIARHEVPGFRMFADDVDARELATLSHGMTGADIKEVLRRVQLAKAMQEARGEAVAPIGQDDLRQCIARLRRG